MEERLQKILAAAGLGSRRSCEELITQGRVSVDGKIVTELGTKADPARQDIRCDGQPVHAERPVYFLINKPMNVVCTNNDERGRPRVVDLLPMHGERLFTVGRLDANTEGLLIVTNDGGFAQRVAHPRYGVTKTYRAHVHGAMTTAAKQELLAGVWILGARCQADWVKVLHRTRNESQVEITVHEGRNREVRRMLTKVGHPVIHLRRVKIGPLEDLTLRPGQCRRLQPEEIQMLLDAASNSGKSSAGSNQQKRPPRRPAGANPSQPSQRGPRKT